MAIILTVTDATGAFGVVGQYLNGLSNLSLATTGLLGAYAKYYLDGSEISPGLDSASGAHYTYGVINLSEGTHTFMVRGFTQPDGHLAIYGDTASVAITVKNYTAPSISAFSAQRCLSDGTIKGTGTNIKYSLATALDPVTISGVNKNTTSIKLRYRIKGTTPWTDIVLTTTLFSWNVTDIVLTGLTLLASNSYDFGVYINDRWKYAQMDTLIPRDIRPFNFKMITGLLSIAVGTLADEAGKFKVVLASKFTETVEFFRAPVFTDIPNSIKALGLVAAHAIAYPRGAMSANTYYMFKWTEIANSDNVNLEPWKLGADTGYIRGWKVKRAGWYRFSHIVRWNSGSTESSSNVSTSVVPSANVANIADSLTRAQIDALSTYLLNRYLPSTTSAVTESMTTDCVYMDADTVIVVFGMTGQGKTQDTTAAFGRFSIERVA